jgi:hypothetical protein
MMKLPKNSVISGWLIRSKHYEFMFKKSHSLGAIPIVYEEIALISMKYLVLIFNFQFSLTKYCSIFNNSCIIGSKH